MAFFNDVPEINFETQKPKDEVIKLFDIPEYYNYLQETARESNAGYKSKNITSYDLKSCIRQTLYKMLDFPLSSFDDPWVPVAFRKEVGNAIHNLIQSYPVFTETEVVLKVPDIFVSQRLDCLINNNVLIEIKTVTYEDYKKILNSKQPRKEDEIQAFFYKYLLENYIDTIKKQTATRPGTFLPKHEKYDIKFIQYIYFCHELAASDTDDMTLAELVKSAKNLKSALESAKNKFWFMTTITQNVEDNQDYKLKIEIITEHLDEIIKHYKNQEVPSLENKFINKKDCFFCLYKDQCNKDKF